LASCGDSHTRSVASFSSNKVLGKSKGEREKDFGSQNKISKVFKSIERGHNKFTFSV